MNQKHLVINRVLHNHASELTPLRPVQRTEAAPVVSYQRFQVAHEELARAQQRHNGVTTETDVEMRTRLDDLERELDQVKVSRRPLCYTGLYAGLPL